MTGNDSFDLYRPRDEHEDLRASIRALVIDKIVPRAAEIDATIEFPEDVQEALTASDSLSSTSRRNMAVPAATLWRHA